MASNRRLSWERSYELVVFVLLVDQFWELGVTSVVDLTVIVVTLVFVDLVASVLE